MSAAPKPSACEHASLPASFFDDARHASAHEDRRAHANRCMLTRALLLASQHRWVADWLFSDPQRLFHNNLPVPLSAFDCAYPMSIMHVFEGNGYTYHRASNMLVVPIASMNSLSVGYTISQTAGPNRKVGRYVFHSTSGEMLLVINKYAPVITAVMCVIPYAHTVKQFLLTCPVGDYSFHNLPNHVFTAHIAESAPNATCSLTPSVPQLLDQFLQLDPSEECLPAADDSNLLSLLDVDTPSQLPWVVDCTSSLSDNVGIPAIPGAAETSSGAFNFNALSESLRGIEHTLQGRFVGTSESHRAMDLTVPPPVERTTVNISTASALEASLLRRYAVNVYFDATTPVLNDEKFLNAHTSLEEHVSASMQAQSQNAVSYVTQRARPIAPGVASVSSDTAALKKTDADLTRERMLEARRRRNRLSAARSNERRRQSWKRSVQALEELKQCVEQLQSTRERLVRENKALRREAGCTVVNE